MAAQTRDVAIASKTWTRVTDNTVSALRLQSRNIHPIFLKATADLTPPADLGGAIELRQLQVITADTSLADLFPGVTSTVGHVWVYSEFGGVVSVSHAAA